MGRDPRSWETGRGWGLREVEEKQRFGWPRVLRVAWWMAEAKRAWTRPAEWFGRCPGSKRFPSLKQGSVFYDRRRKSNDWLYCADFFICENYIFLLGALTPPCLFLRTGLFVVWLRCFPFFIWAAVLFFILFKKAMTLHYIRLLYFLYLYGQHILDFF